MTLEKLQQDMVIAMKEGNKARKSTLSMMIAQIKKSAIDKGVRDNISEEFVDAEILKYQKSVKETVDTLPILSDKWEQACAELAVVGEYAPKLITSPTEIHKILNENYDGPLTKKDLMKFLSANYKGKMDMKVAGSVVDTILKG